MPRGLKLTQLEIGQIIAYNDLNLSHREIARRLGRSHAVVSSYLADPDNYGAKKRPGGKPKLSDRDKRSVIRDITNHGMSPREIRHARQLPCSVRTVQRVAQNSEFLNWGKRKSKPKLTPYHKIARVDWATKYISWTTKWHSIIFSDEKKFNLDGPDGCQYYWHDLRKEPQWFHTRGFGGGSVMVWSAFSWSGKCEIAFLDGRQDSAKYIQTLEDYLLPAAGRIAGRNWIFQQDNCSIHVSSDTRDWFLDNQIEVLDWPACSPDLNPIENLWGSLVRKVYAGGRQFEDAASLKIAIVDGWRQIQEEELKTLIRSMPNRLVNVLKKNGKSCGY